MWILDNLENIKKCKKHIFKYGSLILHVFFFFMNLFPRISNITWKKDIPVAIHMEELYLMQEIKLVTSTLKPFKRKCKIDK